jgi:hypothetical protein
MLGIYESPQLSNENIFGAKTYKEIISTLSSFAFDISNKFQVPAMIKPVIKPMKVATIIRALFTRLSVIIEDQPLARKRVTTFLPNTNK